MGDRDGRAARPVVEQMEERALLSGIIAAMVAAQPAAPSPISQVDARDVTTTPPNTPGSTAGLVALSGNTQAQGNALNNNSQSPLLGNGLPTPQELARESFRAVFTGRDYTGPGRFTSQGTTYYLRGLGGSNFFLHGDFNMAIITPTDPTAGFTGEAVLEDKNINSSGIVGFVLTGSTTAVDSQGRPTEMTFTADPNIYSGIFDVDAAQGTVNITYGAKNAIKVTFSGLVYTTGLTSPLVNSDLYARDGRPVPFVPTTNLSKIHHG